MVASGDVCMDPRSVKGTNSVNPMAPRVERTMMEEKLPVAWEEAA